MSKFRTRLNLNDQNFIQQTGDTLTFSGNILYGSNQTRVFSKNTIANVGYVTGITSTALISGSTNGLTTLNRKIRLGGSLINDTTIDVNNRVLSFVDNVNLTGISIDPQVAGGSILLAHSYVGNLEFKSSGAIFTDTRGTKRGIQYGSNYSSGFNARSLVDAGFVTGITSLIGGGGGGGAFWALTGSSTFTSSVSILGGGFDLNMGTLASPIGNFNFAVANGAIQYTEIVDSVTPLFERNWTDGSLVWQEQFDPTNRYITTYNGPVVFRHNDDITSTQSAFYGSTTDTQIIYQDGLNEFNSFMVLSGDLSTWTVDNSGVSVNIALTSVDAIITSNAIGFSGLQYINDYSSNFTARSLVDKGYVTGITSQLGGGGSGTITGGTNGLSVQGKNIRLGGLLTGNTTINNTGFTLTFGGSVTDQTNVVGNFRIDSNQSIPTYYQFNSNDLLFSTDGTGISDISTFYNQNDSAITLRSYDVNGGVRDITTNNNQISLSFGNSSGLTYSLMNIYLDSVSFNSTNNQTAISQIVTSSNVDQSTININTIESNSSYASLINLDTNTIQSIIDLQVTDGTYNTDFQLLQNDGIHTASLISSYSGFDGLKYGDDYSLNFTARSIVDAGFVTGITSQLVTDGTNGLNLQGSNIRFGGLLTGNTSIGVDTYDLTFIDTYEDSYIYLKTGIVNLSAVDSTGNNEISTFSLDPALNKISINSGVAYSPNFKGLVYEYDYSSSFTSRSLVDKGYLTGLTTTLAGELISGATNGLTKTNNVIELGGMVNKTISLSGTSKTMTSTLNLDYGIGKIFNAQILKIIEQPDGKILVGGAFTTFTGSTNNRLIRLNSNGTKDSTFNIGTGFDSTVVNLMYSTNNKIYVIGYFTEFTGTTNNGIICLTNTGKRENGFKTGVGFDSNTNAILEQINGNILVGGNFSTYSGVSVNYIVSLETNGNIDTVFNNGGSGFDDIVTSLGIQPDGKILVIGLFTTYNGVTANRIARLNVDGSLDTTFNISNEYFNNQNTSFSNIKFSNNGDIYIADSDLIQYGSVTTNNLIKMNSFGVQDTTFQTNVNNSINTSQLYCVNLLLESDGKIIISGYYSNAGNSNSLVRLNSDGTIDDSFNSLISLTGKTDNIIGLIQNNNGELYVSGSINITGNSTYRILKFNGYKPSNNVIFNNVIPSYYNDNSTFFSKYSLVDLNLVTGVTYTNLKPIKIINVTTTLNASHYTVLCNASGGNITLNLPSVAISNGRVYNIKLISSSGQVNINPNGSETIDGSSSDLIISTQWQTKTIHCDGSAWYLI